MIRVEPTRGGLPAWRLSTKSEENDVFQNATMIELYILLLCVGAIDMILWVP
jgi:hypothetical protein